MEAGGDSRRPGTPVEAENWDAFTKPLAPSVATPRVDIRPAKGWSALKMLSAATALLAIIAIAMVATAGGSSAGAGKPYSAAVAQQFTAGCEAHTPTAWTQSTASSYCAAALACVEAHVSYARLVSIDESIANGRGDPDAAELEACTESALRSTPGTGVPGVPGVAGATGSTGVASPT
jgi:hypothetical protein